MAKSPRKPVKGKPEEIETEPDAWERFEKSVGEIVPPRTPKSKTEKDKTPDK